MQYDPANELPMLTFDPEAIYRAVLNIITNAIDACQDMDGGCVVVSTELELKENLLRIVVADNGEGISEENLNRIFSVFESSKGSKGTGLGLSVSQKILREHSGDIFVESEVGKGSRFVLELPAIPGDVTGHEMTVEI